MRSVSVNKDPGLVVFVVGVAAEVIALLDDKARLPLLRGETLGDGQSGKSGTDDEAVDGDEHRAKSLELRDRGRLKPQTKRRHDYGTKRPRDQELETGDAGRGE
jgi:hypothetical protein